jgi:Ran GTPase-activating protein (RanGAP) involved in mRNA processing and transport
MKELKLTKTNLSDAQTFLILKAVENSSPNLTNLNIAKNFISDKSMEPIINCIKNNKSLKTFYLSNNNLSNNAKEKIKSYSTGKNTLKLFL